MPASSFSQMRRDPCEDSPSQEKGGQSFARNWRKSAFVENGLIAALVGLVLVFTLTGASARLPALSYVPGPAAVVALH